MKKLWAALLCFVLLFAMTACGNSAPAVSSEKQDAENEGFTFGDGKKPTARPGNNLYVVNCDWTISHVGWAGHMAFQSAKRICEQELIRVDYERYLLGEENFVINKNNA